MALKWINNVASLPKMWSVQGSAVAAVLAIQEVIPLWSEAVPNGTFAILGAVAATINIFLRALDQGKAVK